jgi:hypothetical protein
MPHTYPRLIPSWARVSAILEACRGAGRRAPAVGFANLASGLVQGVNLLASDYKDPPPGSAGYDGTSRWTSADTSQRYVLVPDVGGCFR